MTSIGAVSAASFLNPASAVQNSGPEATSRHHRHRHAGAADPDGDGVPDAPASSTGSVSAASGLSQALNTTA